MVLMFCLSMVCHISNRNGDGYSLPYMGCVTKKTFFRDSSDCDHADKSNELLFKIKHTVGTCLKLFIDSSEETTEQVVEGDDTQAKTGTEKVTSQLKEETDKAGNQKTGTKPKKALAGKVAKAGTLAVAGTQQVSEDPSKIDETAGSASKESDKKAATKSEPVAKQAVEKSDIKTESGMRMHSCSVLIGL